MNTAWALAASPLPLIIASSAAVWLLVRLGYHRDRHGALTRARILAVFGLAVSIYTFGLCVLSQLVLGGPDVAMLVGEGFGSQRIAWLLLVVTLDQAVRLWDEYRPFDR